MLALSHGTTRMTFPITPTEISIVAGNSVDTFNVITGDERTGKPVSKVKRVSFTAILPRYWREMWEKDPKQTVTYKTPEVTWKLLEKWKKKPVVLNFENLFSRTMLMESMECTYKDGQGNLHMSLVLIEYKPVKIVSYSNSKQMLKPGTIITKASKSRPNTTGKASRKNQKDTKGKGKGKKSEKGSTAKGDFDYIAQKRRIASKIKSVKGRK